MNGKRIKVNDFKFKYGQDLNLKSLTFILFPFI